VRRKSTEGGEKNQGKTNYMKETLHHKFIPNIVNFSQLGLYFILLDDKIAKRLLQQLKKQPFSCHKVKNFLFHIKSSYFADS
jgi:hypothetical protein